jgi:hypothetical protein
MNEATSANERRRRLDLLVDEASMLSFPASDPPAVFMDEAVPTVKPTITDAAVTNTMNPDLSIVREKSGPRA